MRATYLGSNPLTILIRCTCGRRNYFDRSLWSSCGYLRCDTCASIICYKSMLIISAFERMIGMENDGMGEIDASYVGTPERSEIVKTLGHAVELLHRRAEAHRSAHSELRTHRALNRAQQVRSVIDLLALDWHEDDMTAGQSEQAA